VGLLKKIIMEDIFEQEHYDFINSEDYFQYMKEFFEYEEKEALSSELNEL
jgi:radical SAM superfamily enzyme